jgi:hypothetical protein
MLDFKTARPASLAQSLAQLGRSKTLLITAEQHIPPEWTRPSTRVLGVQLKSAKDVVVYDILKSRYVVMDVAAADSLENMLRQTITFRALVRERRRGLLS